MYYLPCIEYFILLSFMDDVVFEISEHFVKQTYRNRTYILGSNGIQKLIVPIKNSSSKVSYAEVEIEYLQKWQHLHVRAIQAAYGKSPFFVHYMPSIREIIYTKYQFLYQLNTALLACCLKFLGLGINITYSESYHKTSHKKYDLRNFVHHKKKSLLPNGITYYQMFGTQFVRNLSVVDLLFCTGPEVRHILSEYKTHYPAEHFVNAV